MESLKHQLDMARFERARAVSESLAEHRALLTTAELARLNGIITGKAPKSSESPEATEAADGPWRRETTTITLPTGRTETMALIVDPVLTAREKLHRATEIAESGAAVDAAVEVYVGLILAHIFVDANRRTAALAAHYFFRRYGVPVSGLAIHNLALGDLRQEGQIEALRKSVYEMVQEAQKK
jgi:hypothetical protein